MEPGRQRESPPGSGKPESGEWREESAAVEIGERDDTLKNRSGDGGNEEITSKTENTVVAEKDKAEFDEDEEQYEEELDPRVQVLGFWTQNKLDIVSMTMNSVNYDTYYSPFASINVL